MTPEQIAFLRQSGVTETQIQMMQQAAQAPPPPPQAPPPQYQMTQQATQAPLPTQAPPQYQMAQQATQAPPSPFPPSLSNEPNLNDRKIIDQASRDNLLPIDCEFICDVELNTVASRHGRNGSFYVASLSILASNTSVIQLGTRRSKIFTYDANAPHDSEKGIQSGYALSDFVALIAAATSSDVGAANFDANALKNDLINRSNSMPKLTDPNGAPYRFRIRQYSYIPRQGKNAGKVKYRCDYSHYDPSTSPQVPQAQPPAQAVFDPNLWGMNGQAQGPQQG
jgi:hypothetical protein